MQKRGSRSIFSNILCTVTLCSKYTRAPTFENLFLDHRVVQKWGCRMIFWLKAHVPNLYSPIVGAREKEVPWNSHSQKVSALVCSLYEVTILYSLYEVTLFHYRKSLYCIQSMKSLYFTIESHYYIYSGKLLYIKSLHNLYWHKVTREDFFFSMWGPCMPSHPKPETLNPKP